MKKDIIVLSILGALAPIAGIAAVVLADSPPEIARAMAEEQAAFTQAVAVAGARWPDSAFTETIFEHSREKACIGVHSVSSATPTGKVLAMDKAKHDCWMQWTGSRTQVLGNLTKAAQTGDIPADLLLAARNSRNTLMPAAPVDPFAGSDAKIEHAGAANTLTYTDTGGVKHQYAVARPKFAQGMVQGDGGGWMYLAPDHKSGRMFNITANGGVTSTPANPMMLQMMSGG